MTRKNPLFLAGFVLPWTVSDYDLVEAGGVEPPSGNIPLQLLRAYPPIYIRSEWLPEAGFIRR